MVGSIFVTIFPTNGIDTKNNPIPEEQKQLWEQDFINSLSTENWDRAAVSIF
jgi:hypothetical protein